MTDTRPGADTCTLWGGALSLYTGKVRSYLIKKGVPYREFYASHPDFQARIRPVVGLGVTPVLETPEGTSCRTPPRSSRRWSGVCPSAP
jgi:glutathione S-transferase